MEYLDCWVCTSSTWLHVVRSVYKVVVQIKLLKAGHCSIILPIQHIVRHWFLQTYKYIMVFYYGFNFYFLGYWWLGIFHIFIRHLDFLFSDSSGLWPILLILSYFLRAEYSLYHVKRFHICLGLPLYSLISSIPLCSYTNTSLS